MGLHRFRGHITGIHIRHEKRMWSRCEHVLITCSRHCWVNSFTFTTTMYSSDESDAESESGTEVQPYPPYTNTIDTVVRRCVGPGVSRKDRQSGFDSYVEAQRKESMEGAEARAFQYFRSKADALARAEALPRPTYTEEIDDLITRSYGDVPTTRDIRKLAYLQMLDAQRTAGIEGAEDRTIQVFQGRVDGLTSGATLSANFPPVAAMRQLQSFNIGSKYCVFYHPMYSGKYPDGAPYIFSVYIGLQGQASDSIITNWKDHGITAHQQAPNGDWMETQWLVAPASSRLRFSYWECNRRKSNELVFPDDPRQGVPVSYLP
ncbi:hypothetical protein R3P38DRAFT_2836355 [Favolaschia claudopus]|uniref:Uncharacterized protein n=1 Tax=Favolaschia claudopus TaxID=2862362 RepID=A0AAW0E5Z0_9AGAR